MTASRAYEYLFCFAGGTSCLAEVRRRDLPSAAPPGRVYHWLYFDRPSGSVTRLLFEAMGEEGGRQTRQFAQGALRFDAVEASLKLEDPAIEAELAAVPAAPADLDAAVRAYLAALD